MATLNYTTIIAVERTVAEMQKMLASHGATSVLVRYSDEQRPAAMSFTLRGPHGDRPFTLPVDVDAMHKSLMRQFGERKIERRYSHRPHAERVAWRVVKDWLAAQLALVAAQMATLDQLMLPYLHVDGETTLYERYREREQQAITVGGA